MNNPATSPGGTFANAGGSPIGDALVAAFNASRDELVSTLMFLLNNRDDAQDIAQDVFLKCWRTRETLTEVTNLRAWIFRVGLNAAKDLRRSAWSRRAKPFLGEDVMMVGTELSPAQQIENQEDLVRLQRAILDLREDEKEVFLLRQNGGLTYEEIAETRHAPVGTVKTQMRSALHKLRKVLA
jgi:RNA polymerase sigma-70 factor, ECF subfamily